MSSNFCLAFTGLVAMTFWLSRTVLSYVLSERFAAPFRRSE